MPSLKSSQAINQLDALIDTYCVPDQRRAVTTVNSKDVRYIAVL